MYCDNGHFCPRCWLDQKLEDLRRGMFRLLPLGYRHRRIMRQAMAWRRLHRENPRNFLLDPRTEHQHRRLTRDLVKLFESNAKAVFAPTSKIEWVEDDVWKPSSGFRPTKEQEAFYEGR